MEALRDREPDLGLDRWPVEEDLGVVVSQDRVSGQCKTTVVGDVLSPLGCFAMEDESVDLVHQTLADQAVDTMPEDTHLLAYIDPDPSKSQHGNRFDSAVGEQRARLDQRARSWSAEGESSQDIEADALISDRRLPHDQGPFERLAPGDLRQDVRQRLDRLVAMRCHWACAPVTHDVRRVRSAGMRWHRQVKPLVVEGPQSEVARS